LSGVSFAPHFLVVVVGLSFLTKVNAPTSNIQYIIITTMPSNIARRRESSEESFTFTTKYPLQSSHQDERPTKEQQQQQQRGGQRRWQRQQHRCSLSPKPSAQATTMLDTLLMNDSESVLLGHESWHSTTSNDYSISSMGKKAYRETSLKNKCEQLGIAF
jgi:hypothetical protein